MSGSFKLIARDNKINIYDPYSDKYHVVEDESELNKLVDSNGNLIPDEQLRQYFNAKESKTRKIQKGFVTKKANLKKEYADVEKQTFKDIVKSKIFQAYPTISSEDLTAFNKNPSIQTIKSFKHIDNNQKEDLIRIFKDNESNFNQELQDKNSLTSLILELQKMNSLYINNGAAWNKARITLTKAKIDEIREAKDDTDKEDKIKELKEQIIQNPSSTTEEVQAVKNLTKENVDEFEKVVDKLDETYSRSEELNKRNKWLFIEGPSNTYMDSNYNDGNSQFKKAVKLNNFSMEPLQKLYKNLKYIEMHPEPLNEINVEKTDSNTTNVSISFGSNDEYKYNYSINNNSPYANMLVSATEKIGNNKEDPEQIRTTIMDLDQQMNEIDHGDYDMKKGTEADNSVTVNVDVKHIEDDSKLANFIMDHKNLDRFNVNDFENYMKSTQFTNLDLDPYVHFKDPKSIDEIDDMMFSHPELYKKNINEMISTSTNSLTEKSVEDFKKNLSAALKSKKLEKKDVEGNIKQELNDIYSYILYKNMFKEKDSAEDLIQGLFDPKAKNHPDWQSATTGRKTTLSKVNVINNIIPFNSSEKSDKLKYYQKLSKLVKYIPVDDINDDLVEANKDIVNNLKVGYAHMPGYNWEGHSDVFHSSRNIGKHIVKKGNETEYERLPSKMPKSDKDSIYPIQSDVYYHYVQDRYMKPEEFFAKGMPQHIRDMLILKLNSPSKK